VRYLLTRLTPAVLAVTVASAATACGDLAAPSGSKHKHKSAHGRAGYITHKNTTSGDGPTVYRLRVAGDHGEHTVTVSKRAYSRCGLGDHYPACIKGAKS
jgi:hypothetical protein